MQAAGAALAGWAGHGWGVEGPEGPASAEQPSLLAGKSPCQLLHCDNVFSFVFTETNRQVTRNLCQMGSRFGKPFPSSPFEWEHVLV